MRALLKRGTRPHLLAPLRPSFAHLLRPYTETDSPARRIPDCTFDVCSRDGGRSSTVHHLPFYRLTA
jgi:hypothetical protein